MLTTPKTLILSQVAKNHKGRIIGFGLNKASNENDIMIKRLRDIGFEEDCIIEVTNSGPFGADPLAVKIDGTTIALRRSEASLIKIQIEEAL